MEKLQYLKTIFILTALFHLEVLGKSTLLNEGEADEEYLRTRRAILSPSRQTDTNFLVREINNLKRQYSAINTKVTIAQNTINSLSFTSRQLQSKVNKLERSTSECQARCSQRSSQTGSNPQINMLEEKVHKIEGDIEIILDQTGVSLNESQLELLLGNRQATYLDMAATETQIEDLVPHSIPIDGLSRQQQDMLGGAFYAIDSRTQQLTSQMNRIEQNMQTGGGTGSIDNTSTNMVNLQSRLAMIEKKVAAAERQGSFSRPTAPVSGRQGNLALGGGSQPNSATTSTGEQDLMAADDSSPSTDTPADSTASLFSVARTTHMIASADRAKEVVFDHTFVNKGMYYHPDNGTFVCGVAGYYFITFTARTFDYKYLGVTLMKNDEPVAGLFSDKHNRNVMQTQSIVTHLANGDILWMRLPPNDQFALDSDIYKMTTFTGFLVQRGEV